MGMEVGIGTNPYKTKQELKDYQGNAVAKATIASAKVRQKKAAKKKKLNYNHRKISRQITMSKTTSGIRRVITRARDQVVDLLSKQMSGKYDETDVRHAIIHARKMERVARKKKNHLITPYTAPRSPASLSHNVSTSTPINKVKNIF